MIDTGLRIEHQSMADIPSKDVEVEIITHKSIDNILPHENKGT
jgi:hypothetical protein